jgi:NSS family neurotransmitter:Na+ symporter
MMLGMKTNETRPRDGFGSGLGALAALVGSAVGLGNIWKFPYLTGENGGAAFVLTYLACVVVIGLPVMVAEHAIGRRMRQNAVQAYGAVVPGQKFWSAIGIAGLGAAFLIMAFYTDVAGWVFAYVFKSGFAAVGGPALGPSTFGALAGGTWEPLAWQFGVLALTTTIIIAGVSKGIERATKILMPLLLILLVVCSLRSLTLPGAWAGVTYLFQIDFTKIGAPVLISALGLAFFKLSLGMGTMTTYGSYLPGSTRIVPNAARVALADTLVSLLAGLAIFPAVFAFGGKPAGGPGLLFNTIPLVFGQMPGGPFFTVLFFVLAAVATIGAMASLFEVPVAWMTEKGKMSRTAAALITGAVMFGLGILATLSQSPVLGQVLILGKSFFDAFDFASSNVLLPLGGLAIAVVAGWLMPQGSLADELAQGGAGKAWYNAVVPFFLKFVAPVLVLLVLLNGWGVLKV